MLQSDDAISKRRANELLETNAGSEWGTRLVALLLLATAISLGFAWVDQFYRGVSVNSILSFMAKDSPWMPVHTTAVPIIGGHYFGDFQLPLAWASNIRHSLSPYLSSTIPANYPPVAIVVLAPFTFLPIKIALSFFLFISASVFLIPLWLLLSPLKFPSRVIVLVPIALLTSPFLSMLDRGNDIGIGLGLVAWTVWAWRKERWLWCGVFLVAAISFKAYPIALLIVPLALRKYRFAAIVLSMSILLNLIALTIIPGGFGRNLRALVPAMTSQQLTTGTQLTSWSFYSILPKAAGLLLGPAHIAQFLQPNHILLWLPSAAYLILIFLVIRRQRVPQWCWGALGLASIQLVVPISGVYTTGWACLAAIWYMQGQLISGALPAETKPGRMNEDTSLRVLVMLAISATLVPSVFSLAGVGGFSILATRFLSPALLFLTLCLSLAKSYPPRNSRLKLRDVTKPELAATHSEGNIS